VTPFQHRLLRDYRPAILKGNAASLLLDEGNRAPQPGTVVRNLKLAETLRRLATGGAEEYYNGALGRQILEDMADHGGFVGERDFSSVPWPVETTPLRGRFQDWDVSTAAPPGGGLTLLEMLNLFEALGPGGADPDAPEGVTLLAGIIRQARRDRRRMRLRLTRDWAFADPLLLRAKYARKTVREMRKKLSGAGETTHLNVIDKQGNIVALTQSIERSFGAKVASRELGFLYNGFMKGFKLHNERHPHYLRPGAVARSNTSPTILCQSDGAAYAIGSTGSERMASGIFQVLVRMQTQSPFDAVKAPRLHCTPEGRVTCETQRFDPRVLEHLSARGFEVVAYEEAWAFSAGGLHLAGVTRGTPWGVADPRRDGLAAGPA
jgi:gamma-glutamyltranspeptidase/glutathione hydrolase